MSNEPDAEALVDRLRDVVSGDAALRQLRRRYESLRHDHETLLDRLAELEDRVAATTRSTLRAVDPDPAPPTPVLAPASSLDEGLVSPLLKLRDDYLSAANGIGAIVEGLDALAAAAFKGQRSSDPAAPRPAPVHHRPAERPEAIEVDVKGSDFGALLDFQERLSSVPGVGRVSIKAIDNERASLLVELAVEPHNFHDPYRTRT